MKESNIILFDGVCNFCNSAVNIVIKHDEKAMFKFAAQQSEIGIALLEKCNIGEGDMNSIVLIQGDQAYFKMDAVIHICQLLTGWPRIFILFKYLPRFLRNSLYDMVANNRYKIFGKRKECRIPDNNIKARFL